MRRLYAAREWIHSVSRAVTAAGVTALLEAGRALEFVHGHPALPRPPFPVCVRGADGMWRLPAKIPGFPLSYSLRARKPLLAGSRRWRLSRR